MDDYSVPVDANRGDLDSLSQHISLALHYRIYPPQTLGGTREIEVVHARMDGDRMRVSVWPYGIEDLAVPVDMTNRHPEWLQVIIDDAERRFRW